MRSDTRAADQLRETVITPHYIAHAEGSVLIEAGRTRVICTASVEDRVPPFLRNTGKGWVTAEYGMLPRATGTRTQREASAGKVGGRTQEIQRLIGRSLRSVTNLPGLGEPVDIVRPLDHLRRSVEARQSGFEPREPGAAVEFERTQRVLRGKRQHRADRCGKGPPQQRHDAQSANLTRCPTIARCFRVSSVIPRSARPSSESSAVRSNGCPSAVPCTSMNRPLPVLTTFMST